MIIIFFPALICIIGLIIYMLSTHPKVQEVGRIMFWTGLLASLLGSREMISILTK